MTCSNKQYSQIQLRRGSNAEFIVSDPVLASGEPAFAVDTNVLKIGDGINVWSDLDPIGATVVIDPEDIQDIVGNNFIVGQSGIVVSYNDGADSIIIALSGQLALYNPADNRILTSDGSASGINSENNLTFDGTLLSVSGNLIARSGTLDILSFNTNNGLVSTQGQIGWNNTEGTVDIAIENNLAMQINEHRILRVRNTTSSTLYKGQVVYASGVHSNGIITPNLYVADGSIQEIRFIGMMLADVNNNNNGFAIDFGHINNIDTRGNVANNYAVGDETWADGDILYVHPTVAGKLTKVEPKHAISVAYVLDAANNGKIFARPTNFGDINQLHDVNTSGATNGQFLQYNSVTDYWVPSSSGNFSTLLVNGTGVSVSGHTHTASNVSDFTEAVQDVVGASGFLIGASGVTISYNDASGTLTITGGGGGATISNAGDNRVLTSDGTSTGINGESSATFDGANFNVTGVFNLDNLRLDGNTISSTNSNGNIVLAPNGTGDVQVDADTLRVGDSNSASTITTNGTGNLTVNTNGGTNSGSIVINQGSNGNIAITPNGTGEVDLSKVDIDGGSIDNTAIGATTASTGKFKQLYPTVISNGTVSGSVGTDVSTGQIFDMTLSGSTTLSNPTNAVDGVTVRWRITQNGTGGHSVTLGSDFQIPSSASSPLPWSTAAGATDILAATYHAGRSKWDVVAFVPGY